MKRMKNTRGLALLLVLLSALLLFAACSGDGTPSDTTAGGGADTTGAQPETVTVDVSQYALLVSDKADSRTSAAAAKLMIAVQDKLGKEFKLSGTDFAASASQIDPNAFEILVGPTNRAESTAALEKLEGGLGFVIVRSGNKIAITASSTALLDEAVEYFVATYLASGSGGTFEIPKELCYVDQGAGGISLLDENGALTYSLVYSDSLDTEKGADDLDRVDYVVTYIEKLMFGDSASKLDGLFQHLDGVAVTAATDKSAPNDNNREILLGRTNRPETQTFLESLKENEYGYGIVGNKLVIAGWSDYTTGMAIELFTKNIGKYLSDNGGKKSFVLVEADRTVEAYDRWNVDLPLYDGGELDGVVQLLNDSYEAVYKNTTPEAYKAYCERLAAEGFRKYQENQIGSNLYATFCDEETMIHVYYVDYVKSVRFITEPMSTVTLPQNEDPYVKITDTSFTMMNLDDVAGVFGNAFIITLEDGSFILHDGGGDLSKKPASVSRPSHNERDELYRLLSALNQREDGKIVIAAWIISHQHWDHFKNGYDMIMEYYRHDVVVERVIYNMASESVRYNSRSAATYYESGKIENVKRATGCDTIVMHTGQTIQIRNLKLEILYTADDIYPDAIEKFNNTSFVNRFAVGEGTARQSVIVVGDIEEVASDRLVKMYGEALQTDVVQVAHHGYGGSVELYALFKPSVVLWPKDKNAVNAQLKPGSTSYYPVINQSLINQKNVVLLVIADDGHKTIPLPLVGLTADRNANHDRFVTVLPRFDGN